MRSVYTDYLDLYESHKDIIAGVTDDLKTRAKTFYESKIRDVCVSDIIYLPSELVIDEIVLNTISDIKRIVDYHSVKTPTFYKLAAYIGFWWQRGKPLLCKVQNYESVYDLSKELPFPTVLDICKSINEVFITDVMLDMIQLRPAEEVRFCDSRSKLIKHTDIKDSLYYFLRYRHYSAQGLELFLKGLNACPQEGIAR